MGDVFGRFVALVLVSLLTAVVLLGALSGRTAKTEKVYIREYLDRFCEKVLNNGEISKNEWEKLLQDMKNIDVSYKVEVLIGRRYNSENTDCIFVTYGTEMVEHLYRDGFFRLKQGDMITFRVEENGICCGGLVGG